MERRDSPYFGLDYYDERFGAWFYGREGETDALITNMQAARLTLLHAGSGVGKSSLLRAGVARGLLLARERDADVDIPVVFSRWSGEPVHELIETVEKAIAAVSSADSAPVLPRSSLEEALVAGAPMVGANLLIILDQFEEYSLYAADEQPPGRFADELARCINRSHLPANFLISIREDAYASLGDLFEGRIANVYGNYLSVEYLSRAAAEDAIRRPLLEIYNKQPGVEPVGIEPELVAAVLDAVVGQQAGAGSDGARTGRAHNVPTPLLQLVMETLWRRERESGSHTLRLSTLRELEGIERIVDTHLERALGELSKLQRETALDIFDRLVTESGGKIAQAVPDLAHRTAHSEDEVSDVLKGLDHRRIVRPVAAAPGQDPLRFRRYEIFHDVLGPAINRVVQKHTEARLRRQRNAARRRVALVGVLALAALAFGIVALFQRQHALHEQHVALSSALAVQSGKLLASDVPLASLLSVEANIVDPTPDARAALNEALEQPLYAVIHETAAVEAVAFAPKSGLFATAMRDGSVSVWSAATERRLERPMSAGPAIHALAFSPDGTLLATGDDVGRVDVWQVAHDAKLAQLEPSATKGEAVFAVSFSHDGRLLAAGGAAGMIALWRVPGFAPAAPSPDPRAPVTSISFAPHSDTLVSGDTNARISFWNPNTGKPARAALTMETGIAALTYNHSGTMLAAADEATGSGNGGQVSIWPLAGGKPVEVKALGSEIKSLSFGESGTTPAGGGEVLAGGDAAGRVLVWNKPREPETEPVVLHDGSEVASVAFSPGGSTIASGDNAGDVLIWSAAPPARVKTVSVGGEPKSVAFSPDGKLLATPTEEGVALQDISTGEAIPLTGVREITSLAFSHHGTLLAAGTESGKVAVWNVRTHAQLRPEIDAAKAVRTIAFSPAREELLAVGGGGGVTLWNARTGTKMRSSLDEAGDVTSISFSPSGELLGIGDRDHTVTLWRVVSRSRVGLMRADSEVTTIAFSPNGGLIASGDSGHNVVVWSTSSGSERYGIAAESKITSVAFSPAGDLLASADEALPADLGGEILLSEASTGARLGRIPGNANTVFSIAFNPQGTLLAGALEGGTVTLDSPQYGFGKLRKLRGAVCGRVRGNLSRAQWSQYVPGEPYTKICPEQP